MRRNKEREVEKTLARAEAGELWLLYEASDDCEDVNVMQEANNVERGIDLLDAFMSLELPTVKDEKFHRQGY